MSSTTTAAASGAAASSDAAHWRATVDERSGRTYWYHKYSRESTWTEPECLKQLRTGPTAAPTASTAPSSQGLQSGVGVGAFPNVISSRGGASEKQSAIQPQSQIPSQPQGQAQEQTRTSSKQQQQQPQQQVPLVHVNLTNNNQARKQQQTSKLCDMIEGLTSPDDVVNLLLSTSEPSQVDGCQLIMETLCVDTVEEWGSHPTLISSLCLIASRPLSSTVRHLALKTLWAFSLYNDVDVGYSGNNGSNKSIFQYSSEWIKLADSIKSINLDSLSQRSWDIESAFYYCYMIALLSVGPMQDTVSKAIAPIVLQFLMMICDSERTVDVESVANVMTYDGKSALSGATLGLLCSYAKQGSLLAGFMLSWIGSMSLRYVNWNDSDCFSDIFCSDL
jgi:hypothetical protein